MPTPNLCQHWVKEYLKFLNGLKCQNQVASRINQIKTIQNNLTHNHPIIYQYSKYLHEAFWPTKELYQNGNFYSHQLKWYYLIRSFLTLETCDECLTVVNEITETLNGSVGDANSDIEIISNEPSLGCL